MHPLEKMEQTKVQNVRSKLDQSGSCRQITRRDSGFNSQTKLIVETFCDNGTASDFQTPVSLEIQ